MKRITWGGNNQLAGNKGLFGRCYDAFLRINKYFPMNTIGDQIRIRFNVGRICFPSKGDLDETI